MPNRLASEQSPYLLQHAGNPVDWMPWGDEAFALAAALDKPLLVSIGYSTCHWCHVMEHESFSDPAVAELMNRNLVCVKVDREERPDVDRVYMNSVTALTGQGGWPLNCFVTPQGKPFFGGTYFPPQDAFGRPAWSRLVEAIGAAWRDPSRRLQVVQDSEKLTAALLRLEQPADCAEALDSAGIEACFADLRRSYDADDGGFGPAPKFPMPVNQHFLFRASSRLAGQGRAADAKEAAEMALETLRRIAAGGIHDHLGGGFARYSTDERWHVPHFEKMLYDNALLAMNFTEAWQLSPEPVFAAAVEGILEYALRDLRSPQGAFFSAEDADSRPAEGAEKKEGAFYVWKRSEIDAVLGDEADRFCSAYGVESNGNVRVDPQREFTGANVLYDRRGTLAAMAGFGGEPPEQQDALLAAARRRLFEARLKRPRPQRDDKILSSWNGLMIAALAKASVAFGRPEWAEAAGQAADFLLKELWDAGSGRLWRRWAGGQGAMQGQADDYAFLAWGLLELHQAVQDPRRLEECAALLKAARPRFYDANDGLYFNGGVQGDPRLPARVKDTHDNVEPAAASVFADLQLRLWALGGDALWREDAERTLKGHLKDLLRLPRALPFMAAALDRALSPPVHVLILGDPGDAATKGLLAAARARWSPRRDILLAAPGLPLPGYAQGAVAPGSKPSAVVCRGFACGLPVTDPQELKKALQGDGQA